MPFKLAVSAEMVFLDLPFIERVKRIHALGFSAEIWGWADKDIQALAATGADFTSMTGYLTAPPTPTASANCSTAPVSPWALPSASIAPASTCMARAWVKAACPCSPSATPPPGACG